MSRGEDTVWTFSCDKCKQPLRPKSVNGSRIELWPCPCWEMVKTVSPSVSHLSKSEKE